MPFLVAIGGISSALIYIIKFLKNILLKYATHAVILSVQFTITASTIAFVILFYGFTITAFISLYNSLINALNYVLNNPDATLSTFYGFLSCMGVTDAVNNGVTLLFASVGSIMIFHLFRFTFGALNVIKNEIFKLGVLLGQAVN